jgi:two-component system sensor histidine kinase MprB
LRTPLTSLRTNIEVLARDDSMKPAEREQLLHDVVAELAEMTALITELVELARGDVEPPEMKEIRLDLLVAELLERARRTAPEITFEADLEETTVVGAPSTLERAIWNLLDNAAKWSAPGSRVEVRVADGEVVVRDHGLGIDEDDLPKVFDRFYRAPSARGRPGSGLGLAIVRQVAEAHGGRVVAERAEGGGTRMTLRIAS